MGLFFNLRIKRCQSGGNMSSIRPPDFFILKMKKGEKQMITMKQLKDRRRYLKLLISEISPKTDERIISYVTTLINERISEIDGLIKDYDKEGK